MRAKRAIVVELTVAALTVLVAGAFTQAAVRDEPAPFFRALETQANELGRKIFEGKGNCWTCHGKDAKGTVLAPDLTDAAWLNIDGSLNAITRTITTGVPKPKQFPGLMPAMGGASLKPAEIDSVAAYVHSLSQQPPAR